MNRELEGCWEMGVGVRREAQQGMELVMENGRGGRSGVQRSLEEGPSDGQVEGRQRRQEVY